MTSIFELPDELFIAEAYFRLLGRPCDPAGFVAYGRALRAGSSRVSVLLSLQDSEEANARPAPLPAPTGLSVDPLLWPATLPWTVRGWDRPKRRQLLSLRGSTFVDALCTFIAPPRASAAERSDWLTQANTLEDRTTLLAAFEANRTWTQRLGARYRPRRTFRPAPLASSLMPRSAEPRRPMPAEARQLENPAHRFQRLKGTAAFTIATRSYLPYVQVLMGSLREFHPDFELICLLVDEDTSKDRDGVGNGCEMQPHWMVLRAAELGIRNFDDMTWRYDTTELCTALKPMFFSWLLQHTAVQCIYYLDPDIRLFAPMTESQDFLRRGAPMILTPHLTEPLQGDSEPSTHTILKSGCFNLGFAAVRRDPRSTAFVDWWAERLRTDAVIDFAANRFTDQRWCDMAPCFVPGLEILRHPGYNVAYWNLVHRRLCRDSFGKWSVDAKNLVFFHFSGVDPRFPEQVSKYQDRLHWKELGDCQTLFEDYIADLLAANWEVASRDPRPYYFQDGVDISQTMRCIYRDLHGQPPEMSRQEILVEMLQLCLTSAEPSASSPADLSALMRWLHARRTDLQVTFNLADAQGARDYCAWFWSSGVIEHGLNSLLHRAAQQPQQQSASDHGR